MKSGPDPLVPYQRFASRMLFLNFLGNRLLIVKVKMFLSMLKNIENSMIKIAIVNISIGSFTVWFKGNDGKKGCIGD